MSHAGIFCQYGWGITSIAVVRGQVNQRTPLPKPLTGPHENPSMVYELEITLRHIEPRVWRLFTVPATITLEQLHEAIIIVMGGGGDICGTSTLTGHSTEVPMQWKMVSGQKPIA